VSVNGIDSVIVGTSTGDEPGLQEELAERKRRLEHLDQRVQRQSKMKPPTALIGLAIVSGKDQDPPSFWSLVGRMDLLVLPSGVYQRPSPTRQIMGAVDPPYGMRPVTQGTMTRRIRFS
jgi:hypothetical protein